jgi:hypothetical protein
VAIETVGALADTGVVAERRVNAEASPLEHQFHLPGSPRWGLGLAILLVPDGFVATGLVPFYCGSDDNPYLLTGKACGQTHRLWGWIFVLAPLVVLVGSLALTKRQTLGLFAACPATEVLLATYVLIG